MANYYGPTPCVPVVSNAEFDSYVRIGIQTALGREMSAAERGRVVELTSRGLLARNIIESIIRRDLTLDEVDRINAAVPTKVLRWEPA